MSSHFCSAHSPVVRRTSTFVEKTHNSSTEKCRCNPVQVVGEHHAFVIKHHPDLSDELAACAAGVEIDYFPVKISHNFVGIAGNSRYKIAGGQCISKI